MSKLRSKAPDRGREARRAVRAEYAAQLQALSGKPASSPAVETRERPARPAAPPAPTISLTLETTSYGPLRVPRPLTFAAQGRPASLEAPTYLDVVRMMPCAICGSGEPFERQLLRNRGQSEANHWPPKGMGGGGGSDFEVHPACSSCHRAITDERPNAQGIRVTHEMLDAAVAATLRRLFLAIRTGNLQIETLTSGAVEAQANRDRR